MESQKLELDEDIKQLLFGQSASDFSKIENGLGGFCPFEAIGMVSQEIKHCHFLAYLLQPNNLHGFGDRPLRNFLNGVADASGDFDKLEIYTRDLADATVRREWNNIDLLIEIPPASAGDEGWVVAVEAKINAEESEDQLPRYSDTLSRTYKNNDRERWKVVQIFLTPDGRLPSEENQALWNPLDFGQVVDGLAECAASGASINSESESLLVAYIDMMRRHHLNNDKLEELAKRLWKKHPEALNFLSDRRPDPITDFKAYLIENMDKLSQHLSSIEGIPEIVFIANSPRSYIRFCVADWVKIEGLASGDKKWTSNGSVVTFELYSGTKGQYALQSIIGPGDSNVRERLHKAAVDIQGFNSWKLGKKFFQLKRWDLVENLDKLLQESDFEEAYNKVANEIKKALMSETGIAAHRQMLVDAEFLS